MADRFNFADFAPMGPVIDDRRNENFGGAWNDDGSFAWQRVPQTLRALGVDVGNSLWGTPMIPEAPDTPLGLALGKADMKIVPQINSRSPLDRAIDDVSDQISMFMPPGHKLGSDVPFTQMEFSAGVPAINALFGGGRVGSLLGGR
jgi:hypothetical protein